MAQDFVDHKKKRFGSAGSAYDADAQAYFTAAGITSTTEKDAVNTMVLALKAASLWTNMDRIFPISPTSLAASKYCVKTLVQLTTVGGVTHGSTGLVFNGSTQYAVTPDNTSDYTNFYIGGTQTVGIYMTAVGTLTGTRYPFGQSGLDGGDNATLCYLRQAVATTTITTVVQGTAGIGVTPFTLDPSFQLCTRISGTDLKRYRNGVQVASTAGGPGIGYLPIDIRMGLSALWIGGASPQANTHFPQTCAFFVIGTGLDATQQSNLYTIIQAYQTALSRNV